MPYGGAIKRYTCGKEGPYLGCDYEKSKSAIMAFASHSCSSKLAILLIREAVSLLEWQRVSVFQQHMRIFETGGSKTTPASRSQLCYLRQQADVDSIVDDHPSIANSHQSFSSQSMGLLAQNDSSLHRRQYSEIDDPSTSK